MYSLRGMMITIHVPQLRFCLRRLFSFIRGQELGTLRKNQAYIHALWGKVLRSVLLLWRLGKFCCTISAIRTFAVELNGTWYINREASVFECRNAAPAEGVKPGLKQRLPSWRKISRVSIHAPTAVVETKSRFTGRLLSNCRNYSTWMQASVEARPISSVVYPTLAYSQILSNTDVFLSIQY